MSEENRSASEESLLPPDVIEPAPSAAREQEDAAPGKELPDAPTPEPETPPDSPAPEDGLRREEPAPPENPVLLEDELTAAEAAQFGDGQPEEPASGERLPSAEFADAPSDRASAPPREELRAAVRRAEKAGRDRKKLALGVRAAALLVLVGALLALFAASIAPRAIPERKPASSSSVPVPSSEPEDDPLSPADPELWSLLLANTEHPLPEGYEPELADTGNGQYVDVRILEPLNDLFDAAAEDGIRLYVRSAYRSEETQRTLFYQLQAEYEAMGYSSEEAYALAKKLRNLPGTSEHQTGLAVDIVSASAPRVNLVASLADTEWAKWLLENAADYGFILRYPEGKTEITGTSFEPWHYRYVGVEDAKKIMAAGLCLEEYLGVAETAQEAASEGTSSAASSAAADGQSSSQQGEKDS